DGMNEKGLVVGLHLVNEKQCQSGFLGTSILRMVLDQCATLSETVSFLQQVPHGYCYNYSIMDKTGRTVVVEASPDRQIVRSGQELVCTNHFEVQAQAGNNRQSIHFSKERFENLQAAVSGKELEMVEAYQLFNRKNSPFFFPYYREYFGTMHTVVYDPMNLRITIGVGGDCQPYQYSLKEWLNNEVVLPK